MVFRCVGWGGRECCGLRGSMVGTMYERGLGICIYHDTMRIMKLGRAELDMDLGGGRMGRVCLYI